MSMKMKLELLPNEIFIECFEYLNAIDIFYSFDQLNDHFNILIRSIPLSLNFKNAHQRFLCDEFCQKMSKDSRIKEQICSLHLSNKNTCYPIDLFLSKFSLLEFSHLRSLTLTRGTDSNWKEIQSRLSQISQLTSFRYIETDSVFHITLHLPESQMRALSFQRLYSNSNLRNQWSSVLYLTVSVCQIFSIHEVLNDLPNLIYLKIKYASYSCGYGKFKFINDSNLKQLHIEHFSSDFSYIEAILRQTRKLEKLTIRSDERHPMDAPQRWQQLISSSLPQLKIFQFEFHFSKFNLKKMIEIFNEFQSDFWCKEHHWNTDYFIFKDSISIYTKPYAFDRLQYTGETNEYMNDSIKHLFSIDNVTTLSIYPAMIKEKSHYYFPNVISLYITDEVAPWKKEQHKITDQNAKHLLEMVNLPNIKHLTLSYIWFESSTVFKDILKATPQLSSLDIHPKVSIDHFRDDELCKYLNKSIKKLRLGQLSNETLEDLEQFCKIFINIEELQFNNNELNVLFLIKHLPKLIYLDTRSKRTASQITEIKKEAENLGLDITHNFLDDDYTNRLSIWINRNI